MQVDENIYSPHHQILKDLIYKILQNSATGRTSFPRER